MESSMKVGSGTEAQRASASVEGIDEGARDRRRVRVGGSIGAPRPSGGRLRSLIRVLEHEMRAPLATALIQLSAAEAALDNTAVDSARSALAGASRQLRALSLVVRRAVQIETDEPIDLFPQRVDLAALVSDFMVRLRATGRSSWARIQLRATKPLIGQWDPAAVEQILENLLTNALKFGEGRPVVLGVSPLRGGARLSVKDAGIGIEARDRERIFGRFARVPSSRGIAGMGIGLWVVRHLVNAHGGRVLVRSRPGKWTVLDVWLPQIAVRPAADFRPAFLQPLSKPALQPLSKPALQPLSKPALQPLSKPALQPASASRSSSSGGGGAALGGRLPSKAPMRSSPCSAAKRTRSPTL
jgi:signal transduction histidine kinase